MADKALEDTVQANIQNKRDQRRNQRDHRTGVSNNYRNNRAGYNAGPVGKFRIQNNYSA